MNQLDRPCGLAVTPSDLLAVPPGGITLEGVRFNVAIGLRFVESWLRGVSDTKPYTSMKRHCVYNDAFAGRPLF